MAKEKQGKSMQDIARASIFGGLVQDENPVDDSKFKNMSTAQIIAGAKAAKAGVDKSKRIYEEALSGAAEVSAWKQAELLDDLVRAQIAYAGYLGEIQAMGNKPTDNMTPKEKHTERAGRKERKAGEGFNLPRTRVPDEKPKGLNKTKWIEPEPKPPAPPQPEPKPEPVDGVCGIMLKIERVIDPKVVDLVQKAFNVAPESKEVWSIKGKLGKLIGKATSDKAGIAFDREQMNSFLLEACNTGKISDVQWALDNIPSQAKTEREHTKEVGKLSSMYDGFFEAQKTIQAMRSEANTQFNSSVTDIRGRDRRGANIPDMHP